MTDVVWRPDEATLEHANATRLLHRAGVADWAELVRPLGAARVVDHRLEGLREHRHRLAPARRLATGDHDRRLACLEPLRDRPARRSRRTPAPGFAPMWAIACEATATSGDIGRKIATRSPGSWPLVIEDLGLADMGWIMGPWTVVGAGALGGTIVFAEGAPDWPQHDRLWRIVEQERVTSLGLSPTLARALLPHGDPTADLSSLRTFVTTGEPWNPEPYRWLFENVGGSRVPVINCTGGTEVGACFLSPTPIGPIKACSVGGPTLGLAMDVVDEAGGSLIGTGEVGELVCRGPFPGMTRGFWRDADKFIETYWSRIPGVWVHGDWASVDADGFWFLHGRSDDTLNIAGKRVGPAELESAAVGHPAVREAAAVGVPHEVKGETAWIFCCLLPGNEPSEELAASVAAAVASELGKAFKPDKILFVDALPKTRSAKIVRRAVRAVALGADPGDVSAIENPESLDAIETAIG